MSNNKIFKYKRYSIPSELVLLTGGNEANWEGVSKAHVDMYRKYSPVNSDDTILEIGCGVGRDAIELSEVLGNKGRYVGIDIIKPSIDWCKNNISKKHKNFKFYYHDVQSQIHNSGGAIKTTDITLPLKDGTVDRIFLHSVFTHMFEKDIMHYLKEFRRVLKSDGLILTSFFILDDEALSSLKKHKNKVGLHPLSFEHKLDKDCYINDLDFPEGAVGFTPNKIKSMLRKSGLGLHGQHVHRGVWSGLKADNGQDVVVLEKVSPAIAMIQSRQKLAFTSK